MFHDLVFMIRHYLYGTHRFNPEDGNKVGSRKGSRKKSRYHEIKFHNLSCSYMNTLDIVLNEVPRDVALVKSIPSHILL